MHKSRIFKSLAALINVLILLAAVAVGQPASTAVKQGTPQPPISEKELGQTQEELIKLLRSSPRLTTVVARDPSLLANTEYVSRNNPQLAQFLQAHPDIARNPEYYLFTNLGDFTGRTELALERKTWPELADRQDSSSFPASDVIPLIIFFCILGALLWLIRVLLENRRWNRIFKLQTEVHRQLIDKFGTSQELLSYMGTSAGSRFLEAAPIPVDFERNSRMPSPVARVLAPLQIGIVLGLLGFGCLFLRRALPENTTPLLVFGTLGLTLGLGFIISAGVTWALAEHLGMIPKSDKAENSLPSSER
jgi:hypothetical protein